MPSLAFPMLPKIANDPSQADFEIVFQTSDTHTLHCFLCHVSPCQIYRGDEAFPAALRGCQQKTEAPDVTQLSNSVVLSCHCGKTRKRACRRKPPAGRTGRATRPRRRSPSSSWNWKTLWRVVSNCGKALGCGSKEPMHPQFRRDWSTEELRNSKQEKTQCRSYQDVDRELGEYVCSAAMVEKVDHSCDPKGATRRANVYAGKCDKMGGSWVSWNANVNDKIFLYATATRNSLLRQMSFVLGKTPRV